MMSTPQSRPAFRTWFILGASSATRFVAFKQWCRSHISQTMIAVCFGFHSMARSCTKNACASLGDGTSDRATSCNDFCAATPQGALPLIAKKQRTRPEIDTRGERFMCIMIYVLAKQESGEFSCQDGREDLSADIGEAETPAVIYVS